MCMCVCACLCLCAYEVHEKCEDFGVQVWRWDLESWKDTIMPRVNVA